MKLADKLLEDYLNITDSDIEASFRKKLDADDLADISIDDVSSDFNGDTVITFSDEEGEEIDVLFTVDPEDGPAAIILDPNSDQEDDDEEEVDIVDLDSLDPILIDLPNGGQALDMVNLSWLSSSAIEAILTIGDILNDEDDLENDIEDEIEIQEKSAVVIRGGKKIRLAVVRRRRKKRLSAKQKAAIRRGVKKRKAKKNQINRKRKKSLRLRKRLNVKQFKSKSYKIQGTGKYR